MMLGVRVLTKAKNNYKINMSLKKDTYLRSVKDTLNLCERMLCFGKAFFVCFKAKISHRRITHYSYFYFCQSIPHYSIERT